MIESTQEVGGASAIVGRDASDTKKRELYDWQDRVMKATKEGNGWQLTAAIYGELQCHIVLLEMRIVELENTVTQLRDPPAY